MKPSDSEIVALALRETDPSQAARFEPVARGPVFAIVAILAIGLAAIPACLVRVVRALLSSAQPDE